MIKILFLSLLILGCSPSFSVEEQYIEEDESGYAGEWCLEHNKDNCFTIRSCVEVNEIDSKCILEGNTTEFLIFDYTDVIYIEAFGSIIPIKKVDDE